MEGGWALIEGKTGKGRKDPLSLFQGSGNLNIRANPRTEEEEKDVNEENNNSVKRSREKA